MSKWKAKSLDALKLEYADLIDRYHEIEALLPEVKQVPSILVQLHTASSITGTRYHQSASAADRVAEFYDHCGFRNRNYGTYHDFGKFASTWPTFHLLPI